MKLKDIADMEDYLENRCYCPYEIYDLSGFFFNLFKPDTDCELFAEGEKNSIHGTFVLAKASEPKETELQIIYIEHEDGYVESCIRLDATENNKEQILKFLDNKIDKIHIDEYPATKTKETLEEVLSVADAICM